MDIFTGEINKNGCNLSQKGPKMGPGVLYCCWVLLSSSGVNNSLSTIFLGHPVGTLRYFCVLQNTLRSLGTIISNFYSTFSDSLSFCLAPFAVLAILVFLLLSNSIV